MINRGHAATPLVKTQAQRAAKGDQCAGTACSPVAVGVVHSRRACIFSLPPSRFDLMRGAGVPEPDPGAERWRVLLVRLGQREGELAEGYLTRIRHGAEYYDGMVGEEDLRASARRAFRYLLQTLLGQPLSTELAAFPRQVGARRARQGVALENLTAAVRTDFMVAWSAMMQDADERDLQVMAAHVEDLWRAVDVFASQIQMGYLDERIASARSSLHDQH